MDPLTVSRDVVTGGTGDIVVQTEQINNDTGKVRSLWGVIIGELSTPDYDVMDSVVYSHNYFEKSLDGLSAVCLTCQLINSKLGPRDVKKKESFSIQGSSTSGKLI